MKKNAINNVSRHYILFSCNVEQKIEKKLKNYIKNEYYNVGVTWDVYCISSLYTDILKYKYIYIYYAIYAIYMSFAIGQKLKKAIFELSILFLFGHVCGLCSAYS